LVRRCLTVMTPCSGTAERPNHSESCTSDERPAILNQLNLVITDRTLRFYRLRGIETEASPPEWAAHHAAVLLPTGVRLEFDGTRFAKQWNPGRHRDGGGRVMFFGIPCATMWTASIRAW
jgi:hypothetical protein